MSNQVQNKKQTHYKNPIENILQRGDYPGVSTNPQNEAAVSKLYEQMLAGKEAPNEQARSSSYGKEFTIFTDRTDYEDRRKKTDIENILDRIRQEIQAIRSKTAEFDAQIAGIEAHTLQSLPERTGVYHVRFLETLLVFLQGIRTKVGEAKTWMQAMQSKRSKRGSAFMTRSKKQGTQYSMSQELQTSRNVM